MGIVREGTVIIDTSLNRMFGVHAFLYLCTKTKDDKIPVSFSCHRLENNKVKWNDLKNSYIVSKNRQFSLSKWLSLAFYYNNRNLAYCIPESLIGNSIINEYEVMGDVCKVLRSPVHFLVRQYQRMT